MAEGNLKRKTITGLFWSFAERVGAQLVSFVVSVVLARLLYPEEYGMISIVLVFIEICNVFVDSGFGKALIQKQDADELDFCSVFYFSFVLSLLLYVGLFFASPYIALFYEMDGLTPVIRVMGLRMIIASYNSVQKAKISRELDFRKFFYSTLGGTLISALAGIWAAYQGWGVWALVVQYMTNSVIDTLVLSVTVKWVPKLIFSVARMKIMFGYGWKILVGALIDTLYNNFRSLYVGKLYSADDLAYYNRGQHFPSLIVNNINSSISSVLFPVISSQQNDREAVKNMTRRAMKTSAYIITPLLAGLAIIGEPLVVLLLTEKWLPCVPFLQILCINYALMPLQTANIQAIYAMGRSDIGLKLNVVKKLFGFTMVLVFTRISVIAMALAGVLSGFFSLVMNILPNRKLLGYGFLEQMRDVVPYWIMSGFMILCVYCVSFLGLPVIAELMLMVITGVAVYVLTSIVFKVESFTYLLNTIKQILKR